MNEPSDDERKSPADTKIGNQHKLTTENQCKHKKKKKKLSSGACRQDWSEMSPVRGDDLLTRLQTTVEARRHRTSAWDIRVLDNDENDDVSSRASWKAIEMPQSQPANHDMVEKVAALNGHLAGVEVRLSDLERHLAKLDESTSHSLYNIEALLRNAIFRSPSTVSTDVHSASVNSAGLSSDKPFV